MFSFQGLGAGNKNPVLKNWLPIITHPDVDNM